MAKKLFMKDPIITSYPTQANIFASMPNDEYLLWFYEHSLNLFTCKSLKTSYIGYFSPIPWKSNPWFISQEIGIKILNSLKVDIVDFIRTAIDNDFYVFLFLNRFHLRKSPQYCKKYMHHDIFLYGYDENAQIINYTEFYGKFAHYEADFNEIRSAFYSLNLEKVSQATNYIKNITLIKPVYQEWYTFNIKNVVTQLDDYLSAKTSYSGYTNGIHLPYEIGKDGYIFGIEIYDHLATYLETLLKEVHDIRGFHALYDHKVLLQKMVQDLIALNYLRSDRINDFRILTLSALRIRNLVLKVVIKNDYSHIPLLKKRLQELKQQEIDILSSLKHTLCNMK